MWSNHLMTCCCNLCPNKIFGLVVRCPFHMYIPFSGHRTKHKGQKAGVRGHSIPRVPWVSSQNLYHFSKPSCSPGPHQRVPPMAPCIYALTHTLLWWVKRAPECITCSPQYTTSRLRPVGVGSNDAEGAETHTEGRFHFLHILQRLIAHSCWTPRLDS